MNRKEKEVDEKKKLMNEYCSRKLTKLLQDEDNKYCVDCDAKGPRWVSWNLGVFLCIRCAGIHRNLGVHISKVKSVNLDSWTPEQVVSMENMGNSRGRAVYEANVPDNFRRPQTDSSLESFIRAKYEQKKYIAKEWVPTPIPTKVDWEKEMEDELDKQKKKKKIPSTSGAISIPAPLNDNKKSIVTSKTTAIPPPISKSGNFSSGSSSNSPKSNRTERKSASSDLLGLNTNIISEPTKHVDTSDAFANFLNSSAPVQPQIDIKSTSNTTNELNDGFLSLEKEEADFFNQTPTNKETSAKLTKDSILALYGAGPAIPTMNPVNSFNNFNNGTQFATPLNTFNSMPSVGAQIPFNNHQFGQPVQSQAWPQTTQWAAPTPMVPAPPQVAAFNFNVAPSNNAPTGNPNDSITKHFGNLNLNNVWQN